MNASFMIQQSTAPLWNAEVQGVAPNRLPMVNIILSRGVATRSFRVQMLHLPAHKATSAGKGAPEVVMD